MKKLISIILTIVCTLSVSMTALASDKQYNNVNVLSQNPPSASLIVPYGANPPSSSAETVNLSNSTYSYVAEVMDYRLYTNKWITGTSSISVSVSNWTLLTYYEGATWNKLTDLL